MAHDDADMAEAGSSRKRTVDADDESRSLPDPTRPRVNIDSKLKEKILGYIIASVISIFRETKFKVIKEPNGGTPDHECGTRWAQPAS